MPFLSVVIPTLNRLDTLRHAVSTLMLQSCSDCEFIIQNNGGNAEIASFIETLGDPRFKHFTTQKIVTMPDNWELALDHATGDYVTFIGDDDGLMPDACTIATNVLQAGTTELLSWAPYAYYWPSYYHADFRNRLVAQVDFRFTAVRISSRAELARIYNFQAPYSRLPMIYNSFVRRDVVARMKTIAGRYFLGSSPDVTSGIANAALTESFLRLSRPLSISGLSQHSTGHTCFFEKSDVLDTDPGRRDFGAIATDPRLPDVNALHSFLANDMLLVKQQLFPADGEIALNFKGLAQAIATNINSRPEIYDQILKSVRELAALHGFGMGEISVPPRATSRPSLGRGVVPQGRDQVQFLLDGESLGLQTVADAVRVMAQFIPGSDGLDPSALSRDFGQPLVDKQGLDFARGGTGEAALVEGWSVPEGWGVWSAAKNCTLQLKLRAVPTFPVALEVACRALVHQRHPRLRVACYVGAMAPQEWEFSLTAPGGHRALLLDPTAVSPDGDVTITFTVDEPRSPADLGVNDDVRPLGIGIERMWIAG